MSLFKVAEKFKKTFYGMYREDVEVGCNIFYDHNGLYLGDFVEGDKEAVYLPENPYTIGSFHTHVDTNVCSWGFSNGDVSTGVKRKERYMFLLVDDDLYGVDMRQFAPAIERYKKKKFSIQRLTRQVNRNKVFFDL